MDESSDAVAPFQLGGRFGDGAKLRSLLCGWGQAERAARPVRVVVVDEDAEYALKVASVHAKKPIEALGASGSHEALGDRVRLRCAHRSLHDLDALASEDGVEVARELAVAVADQAAKGRGLLLECPGELARLLRHPGAGRVVGAASEVDPAAGELDEEEDVDSLQGDRLDGEEVDREHALRLLPQEGAPRKSAALAGGADARLTQDLLDGRRRHPQTEPVDLADDTLVAPARVLSSEAKDELADLTADRRATRLSGVRPAASNQTAVPAQQRRRRHKKRLPTRPRQQPTRGSEKDSVTRPQLRTTCLAAKHRQLMPEHHDLELLEVLRPGTQEQKLKQAAQRQVAERREQ